MSVVIGVRVPKRLKEELEELGIDYAEEIRKYLEKRVRQERMRRALKELMSLREEIGPVEEDLAASLAREERDEAGG